MENIEKMIKEQVLSHDSKKIKNESINEYLSSVTREELTRFAITQVFVDMDYANVHKVRNLANKPKQYIIDYIMDNLEKILKAYLKIIKTNEIESLKNILNNEDKDFLIKGKDISLMLISFLKTFSLAKVEYHKKDDSLKIFMPKEYILILKGALKDKKLLEENTRNNTIFAYVETVINTYGIITMDKLHEIFEKQMFKIDKDELQHIINFMGFYDEVYIYEYENKTLICNLEFVDEDYAIGFYETQRKSYTIYSKEEYKSISDRTYVKGLTAYRNFVDYLLDNFENIPEILDFIDDFIVNDFINFAQIGLDDAERAFRANIVRILDVDSKEIEELLKLLKSIFKQFPKWKKRGAI